MKKKNYLFIVVCVEISLYFKEKMLLVAIFPGRVISPLFQCHSLGGARGSGGQRGGVPYDPGFSVPHGFPDRRPCPPGAGGRAEGPWVSALLGVHQGLRV